MWVERLHAPHKNQSVHECSQYSRHNVKIFLYNWCSFIAKKVNCQISSWLFKILFYFQLKSWLIITNIYKFKHSFYTNGRFVLKLHVLSFFHRLTWRKLPQLTDFKQWLAGKRQCKNYITRDALRKVKDLHSVAIRAIEGHVLPTACWP